MRPEMHNEVPVIFVWRVRERSRVSSIPFDYQLIRIDICIELRIRCRHPCAHESKVAFGRFTDCRFEWGKSGLDIAPNEIK